MFPMELKVRLPPDPAPTLRDTVPQIVENQTKQENRHPVGNVRLGQRKHPRYQKPTGGQDNDRNKSANNDPCKPSKIRQQSVTENQPHDLY